MHSKNVRLWSLALALPGLLAGCGGGGRDDGVVVRGEYPIAYVDRDAAAVGEPADGIVFVPGGDLYLRDLSSPRAPAANVTRRHTQGRGDVTGPEVSYDGRRIVFSMRGPDDPTWNVWEYSLDSEQLHRVIADDMVANAGDDVDPYYLPDGRIVFTSNRQAGTRDAMAAEGIEPYAYREGYGREAALVLHVMNPDGSGIEQISFNQSHDRNPTVRMSGEIVYARWDHVGNRNQQPIFTIRPDGRELDVLYGAFSPGDSFLQPREMPDGRIISTLLPLAGGRSGGALVIADVADYSDHRRRLDGGDGEGQRQPTLYELPLGRQASPYGRYTAPYPLWDGSNRVLVAWSPQQRDGATSPVLPGEAEPRYGIYMLDLNDRSLRPIVLASAGRALTDPVAVMPRPMPTVIAAAPPVEAASVAPRPFTCDDGTTAWSYDDCPDGGGSDGGGSDGGSEPEPEPLIQSILNIRSVYDTDFLDSMGDSALADGESIPRRADGRPDLARLRELPAEQRPARFLRVSRAVPLPPGLALDAVGGTSFGMQQILGYAPIEPDGSVRVAVPADVPLAVAVVDADGRAFQTHTNWLQTRPGEERTCNGCHSGHRVQAPLNTGLPAGGLFFPSSNPELVARPGETMAEARTRICPSARTLQPDPSGGDFWTDPAAADCPAPQPMITYDGLQTEAPTEGLIDYERHIQPLWERSRPGGSCVSCHTAGGALDLSGGSAASGRMRSYDSLVLGQPRRDPQTGALQVASRDGRTVILRDRPLVDVGGSANSSRSSHLAEVVFWQELLAPQSLPNFDHADMLNPSEARLVAEWIDLGAPYRTSPRTGAGEPVTDNGGLDPVAFRDDVHPLLMRRCAGCHLPVATGGDIVVTNDGFDPDAFKHRNPEYAPNRFVLTGNAPADFGAAAGMVIDACRAESNPLLLRPRSDEQGPLAHPTVDRAGTPDDRRDDLPVVQQGGADYRVLLEWIAAGCR